MIENGAERPAVLDAAQTSIIVTFLGNPMPNTDGNLVRIKAMLHFLMKSGFRVTFYSYANAGAWPWTTRDEAEFRKNFPQVTLVLEQWNIGVGLVQRVKNNLLAFVPSFTSRIVAGSVPGLTPKWSKLRAQSTDSVYLLNYAMNATQVNGVDLAHACIETHDLCFRDLALSRKQPIWHWDMLRRMRRELSILQAAGIVLAIARTEQIVLETLLPTARVRYLPPSGQRRMAPQSCTNAKTDLLFLGSGNYKNIEGLNAFLGEYRCWKTRPTLAIAGGVSNYVQLGRAEDSAVSVLGYVPDLPSLYQGVRATICPVEGTGVNIKLMEALAYGKPTFASRGAIAALPPGWEGCVFPLSETSIREILGDPERLRAASLAALKYVNSPYIRDLWHDFRQALVDLAERIKRAQHAGEP